MASGVDASVMVAKATKAAEADDDPKCIGALDSGDGDRNRKRDGGDRSR